MTFAVVDDDLSQHYHHHLPILYLMVTKLSGLYNIGFILYTRRLQDWSMANFYLQYKINYTSRVINLTKMCVCVCRLHAISDKQTCYILNWQKMNM